MENIPDTNLKEFEFFSSLSEGALETLSRRVQPVEFKAGEQIIKEREEHIKGALNIPIEVLRDKFSELDMDKEYFTYCTNDSRGMTAAFLMKSLGYNVKALRGGLSAWDGPTTRGGDGIHSSSASA
jgi:3-mercaptopyruvate sulfurtransferase SseA